MSDIYSNQPQNTNHSLRYIHITARNVIGILNRISSLMRRKRYNMEEVSVSFDDENKAHIIIAVDGNMLDIELVMNQINKLHDVFDVYDASHLHLKLFNGIYVELTNKKEFEEFPIKPLKIIKDVKITGIFMVPIAEVTSFYNFLNKKKYKYIRRIISLI